MTSRRRANTYFFSLLLIGLALLTFREAWWPSILLVLGIPLALRQGLRSRWYDVSMTILVFCGGYIVASSALSKEILIPILLVIAAIYLPFRELAENALPPESELEEDLNLEIEEESEEKK